MKSFVGQPEVRDSGKAMHDFKEKGYKQRYVFLKNIPLANEWRMDQKGVIRDGRNQATGHN